MMPENVVNFPGSEPDDRHKIYARRIKIPKGFSAPKWVINKIIPEGVGVISGSAGVGKTSALIPLVLAVAGFKSPICDLEVEMPRRVIYFTEDDEQVMLILNGMRTFLKWDDPIWDRVIERFQVIASQRLTVAQLQDVMIESQVDVVKHRGIETSPLMVFDTSSANFDLLNENDNSQASGFMAVLKQAYSRWGVSSWIITHLAKTAKGAGIEAAQNSTARGAGSVEGDGMWTAVLSSEQNNNEGPRILKMGKRRQESIHNEIVFDGSIQYAQATDRFGETVDIEYRYTVPRKSSTENRRIETGRKEFSQLQQDILDIVPDLPYPSGTDVRIALKKDKNAVTAAIKSLMGLPTGLRLVPLPPEIKAKGRKTDYLMAVTEEAQNDAF
jgi:hypothetical protein